jgi:predicted amidohydrolase YtcJ
MVPELVLFNGSFRTLDPANPTASAVAISGGKFTAVGLDRDIRALAGPETKVIDLHGRCRA